MFAVSDLQQTAAAAVGVEKIQLQHLERVQPRHVLTLVATALAAYFLRRPDAGRGRRRGGRLDRRPGWPSPS